MHAQSGQLELRSATDPAVRVLAPSADLTVYDPALELLWYTDEERLYVIDLRVPSFAPIQVASGIPDVSLLQIRQRDRSVATQEACQGPKLDLLWNESPTVEAYDADASDTRLDGRAWLQAQTARPAGSTSKTLDFDGAPVPLPRSVLDCEEPSFCAKTVGFGSHGLQLVLVLDKSGGDCWNRACLLHDPSTGLYASPPDAEHWGPAAKTKRGQCGLYYFDQAGSSFLVGTRLCVDGGRCKSLDGQALGWLHGGAVVGAIGDIDEEEQ